ncbi:MAG: hypothetical protein RBR78_06550 [Flavobacteriaceae bacterium]|jgi:hypothetical protein|nr:hypothetical protein [Flavobacteriaceae bacterium]
MKNQGKKIIEIRSTEKVLKKFKVKRKEDGKFYDGSHFGIQCWNTKEEMAKIWSENSNPVLNAKNRPHKYELIEVYK